MTCLLLDTHVLLWWLNGDPIEPAAAEAIGDPTSEVLVSAASIWEIAIKRALRKLDVEGSVAEATVATGFNLLSVSAVHAEAVGELPLLHRDPFDRLLVAQARREGSTLVSRDTALRGYDVPILIA